MTDISNSLAIYSTTRPPNLHKLAALDIKTIYDNNSTICFMCVVSLEGRLQCISGMESVSCHAMASECCALNQDHKDYLL
jgi:hypothetical protein